MARILIAEDEEALRAMCARALSTAGHDVKTACDGGDALDVLQRVQRIPRERLDEITLPLVGERMTLVAINEQIARTAADIRARHYHRTRAPLSLADCILLAATGESDILATADGPLLQVAEAEHVNVKQLPR